MKCFHLAWREPRRNKWKSQLLYSACIEKVSECAKASLLLDSFIHRRRSCSAHCLQLLSARLLVFLVHATTVQKALVSDAPLRIFVAALDATNDPVIDHYLVDLCKSCRSVAMMRLVSIGLVI